jgi:hypothetical protein
MCAAQGSCGRRRKRLGARPASSDYTLTLPSRYGLGTSPGAIPPGTQPTLDPPDRPLRSRAEFGRGLLPGLTPIRQALPLTPELLATLSHSSATLRAHAIQNAGDHIRIRFDCVVPHELHTHLTNDNCSAIGNPVRFHLKHDECPHGSRIANRLVHLFLQSASPGVVSDSAFPLKRNGVRIFEMRFIVVS